MKIDFERLAHLMEEYAEATSRSKQRRIENEVLAETVGQVDTEPFATFSKQEVDVISEHIDSDDEDVNVLLRRPYVMKVWDDSGSHVSRRRY